MNAISPPPSFDGPTDVRRTLLVLTNIPTPYRTNFFNALAGHMRAQGDRLFVAYCARSEWHRQWEFVPGENRYDYVFLPGWSRRVGMLTFHFNPAVLKLLRSVRPDWVLAAGSWNMPTGMLALMHSRIVKRPIIFWTEGHEGGVRHHGGVIPYIRRFVVRRYTGYAVPNSRSQRFVAGMARKSAAFLPLPNTVNDAFFTPRSDEARARARTVNNIRPEDCLVAQVSHLEHHKGVPELCDAFGTVAARNPNLRLALIGSGNLTEALKQRHAAWMRSGSLIITGPLPAEAVRSWLYAADCFVLASRRDNNPLSAIEAALCGVPLILSRFVGNIAELLGTNEGDWTIREITAEGIAKPLVHLATRSREEIQLHGAAGCERARAIFRTPLVASNFYAALTALPSARR